ncbi:Toxin YoeB [termite gut metagenome]|jgi:toxin YoeB|uniref:Putative mRNA interferase YoeB n=1 Tax=termite gut metagenome TaxID=433724 RepID=A0A5J4RUH8_9ZZZZ
MRIILSPEALEDLEYWKAMDASIVKRIKRLLEDISQHPDTGLGKPERLKYGLSGKWSRRINSEHRIIYKINDDKIEVLVLSMRYHYKKKD